MGDSWHGIFAPKATSQQVLDALLAQSQRIVAGAEFRATLQGYGLTPVGEPPEAFRRFLEADARAWAKVVKENGIAAE